MGLLSVSFVACNRNSWTKTGELDSAPSPVLTLDGAFSNLDTTSADSRFSIEGHDLFQGDIAQRINLTTTKSLGVQKMWTPSAEIFQDRINYVAFVGCDNNQKEYGKKLLASEGAKTISTRDLKLDELNMKNFSLIMLCGEQTVAGFGLVIQADQVFFIQRPLRCPNHHKISFV